MKHETGIAWRCAGCGGQTLNFSQFRRLVPEPRANRIWEQVMEKPSRPRMKSLCPECRRDMAAVFVPAGSHTLELDICRGCQRVWLDPAERPMDALPGEQDAVPMPLARPMTGAAQERLARHLVKRAFFRPEVYEWIGRLTLAGVLLYLAVMMVKKVLLR
jgi:hypothetical protein